MRSTLTVETQLLSNETFGNRSSENVPLNLNLLVSIFLSLLVSFSFQYLVFGFYFYSFTVTFLYQERQTKINTTLISNVFAPCASHFFLLGAFTIESHQVHRNENSIKIIKLD